ncbi:MAG: protease3, partial [Acidobacteria bacterium]|nr:protease3 [Acidobacteriota bacterium]
ERYFGDIPPGPHVEPISRDASLAGEARLVLEDAVELPRLYLAWHSPAIFAPGDAEMDLVAEALAEMKISRLYRRLIFDGRLATDVSAAQQSRELSGFFQVVATASPGHALGELDAVVQEEIARLAAEGPDADELERGHAQAEAQFVFRLQTVGGFGGKSDQLNQYNVFLRDPAFLLRDLERYRRATAEGVREAAERVLVKAPRVALSVVPKGRVDLALPGSARVVCS